MACPLIANGSSTEIQRRLRACPTGQVRAIVRAYSRPSPIMALRCSVDDEAYTSLSRAMMGRDQHAY